MEVPTPLQIRKRRHRESANLPGITQAVTGELGFECRALALETLSSPILCGVQKMLNFDKRVFERKRYRQSVPGLEL